MTRRVVLTADDLGCSPAVNEAIADLAEAGRVGAASLLVRRPWSEDAVALGLPVAVGLHVEVPPALLTGGDPASVRSDIEAQVAWCTARGLAPTHLDLHTAAAYGLAPGVRAGGAVVEALHVAAALGVPLRIPRHLPGPVGPAVREVHARLVGLADSLGVPIPETLLTDPRDPAQISGPEDIRDAYVALAARVPPGLSEVVLHPGGPDAADALSAKRTWEAGLLRGGALHEALARAGVEVTARAGS